MTPDSRSYRSVAELLVVVRDHHRLTQRQLGERSGVGQGQLARVRVGEVEPGLPVLRRVLRSVGWLPTLGIEPTATALDEQLTRKVAAALQGVPIRSTDVRSSGRRGGCTRWTSPSYWSRARSDPPRPRWWAVARAGLGSRA